MKLKELEKRKRLINFIIDLIVIAILIEITIRIEELVAFKTLLKVFRVIIILGGYYIPMEYFLGKTIGKYVTKSKVVSLDGTKISFRASVIRFLCRWIPFEFASLALGSDAKAWHDVLSKTLVVEDAKNYLNKWNS